MAEINRAVGVLFPGFDLPHPAPKSFDDLDPCEKDDLWGKAPWFDRRCLAHLELLRHYADDDDELPGGIPVAATQTWAWRNHYFYVNGDLHTPGVDLSLIHI